jgi:hypothetical protein
MPQTIALLEQEDGRTSAAGVLVRYRIAGWWLARI